ncbi:TPA: adenylosuccinate synthetase [Candidatus Ventrenecus stercoripullorum]|nr:adenylosuccinate synthetase [Candidatus Ventrenecus stercoripullorum]
MNKNVIAVIDGAAGSCGKAKVVGEIATDKNIKLGAAVTNCMPNAGHTFVDENGNATVFRNIPVSIVNPETELFIGPGSAIDMTVFQAEYEQAQKYLKDRKIYVHEMVPLIESRHKQYEKEHIKTGSTFKGGNAVTCEKIMKEKNLEFFQTYKNAVVCSNNEWHERLYQHLENPNEYVILEGAQGCDLDINHSGHYPNTTCREVSTMQLLADSGIAAERLLETIMVIRPFPIRISNITSSGEFIYSGNYGNGDELTWTEINIATLYGGYPHRSIVDCYNSFLKIKKIKKLLSHCPEIYLKQTFGDNYKSIKIDEITLLEALELERLMYKARKIQEYQTRLIELPMFDKDFPPNTIIDQSEQTTVTKMERRIFDLDIKKLKLNCQINNPYVLYLNFFQHLGLEYKGEKGNFENYYFNRYLREYFDWLERNTQVEIAALGTGPKNMERILKKPLIK